MTISNHFILFTLHEHRYALPLQAVERVIRAVEVTPLPQTPKNIRGIINLEGDLICVFDTRRYFQLPEREIGLGDRFIIAHTNSRKVALPVDTIADVAEVPDKDIVGVESILSDFPHIGGAVKRSDGMILIADLDQLITGDDELILDEAMIAHTNGGSP